MVMSFHCNQNTKCYVVTGDSLGARGWVRRLVPETLSSDVELMRTYLHVGLHFLFNDLSFNLGQIDSLNIREVLNIVLV